MLPEFADARRTVWLDIPGISRHLYGDLWLSEGRSCCHFINHYRRLSRSGSFYQRDTTRLFLAVRSYHLPEAYDVRKTMTRTEHAFIVVRLTASSKGELV